ncbi:DUF4932 domain-containing protein [bacterium]|nr:DUF4932 domain-containing protein [bacterium]
MNQLALAWDLARYARRAALVAILVFSSVAFAETQAEAGGEGRASDDALRKIRILEKLLEQENPTELPAEVLDETAVEQLEPPGVTSILPDPGDDEVSVTLDAIRVTFDQDMDTSHSWVGEGPDFPPLRKGQRPRWIDLRTCIYPAELKPGKFYRMQINSKTEHGFRSKRGQIDAEPVPIWFVTQGADLETARRGLRPQVARMEPDSGDGEVDPATSELRVTFNVPMGNGSAFVGAGEHYPESPDGEQPHWSADHRTCILPVRLEGDWEYQLALNGNGRSDFQSAAGVPLDPIFWTFQTKKALAAAGATSSTLSISVDPRVELISIIFRLAGNPEYNRGAVASYNDDVERWFGGRKQHAAVKLAGKLRNSYGVGFDAPMSLAIRMPQAMSDLAGDAPWRIDAEGIDARWQPAELKEFCEQARLFAQASRFDKFFADHADFYKEACDEARRVIERDVRLDWFDKFFGARPGADFRIAIAPLTGGGNYGPSRRVGKREEMYCILGVWFTDRYGGPAFSREASGVVAHEFNHSYSNPVVFRHMNELRSAGVVLFKPVAARMRRQAYGHWETMMIESLVRAAQVRYVREVRGPFWGQQALKEEVSRGFTWTPGLVDLFDEYQKDRAKYPTLESFFPRVVEFFNEYSKKTPDKTKPMVVELIPADGANNVDPAMTELRVTFDRPMGPGVSWVGGGPSFPEIPAGAKPGWSADRKTCALPVKLKPGTDYVLNLNSFLFKNFQDSKGVPLEPVEWKFRTKE